MENINQGMAEGFYRLWWKKCGTQAFTLQEKEKILYKLSDLSLKQPYWKLPDDEATKLFPELVPSKLCNKHRHLNNLTGLLLYVIHTEIFNDIKQSKLEK